MSTDEDVLAGVCVLPLNRVANMKPRRGFVLSARGCEPLQNLRDWGCESLKFLRRLEGSSAFACPSDDETEQPAL